MIPADIQWTLTSPAELPVGLEWLSRTENAHLQRLKFPKRRAEWLLGRWAAKKLLSGCLPDWSVQVLPQLSIENEPGGAPFVIWKEERLVGCLSLSHRADLAAAAWCPQANVRIGIDLELIEPKSSAFVNDYFTAEEAACVWELPHEAQALAACLIWSAKEALLKALQTGLRIDTRQVALGFGELYPSPGWQKLAIIDPPSNASRQQLFWLSQPPYVVTLAEISGSG